VPHLVVVSVTDFGWSGPRAHLRGSDLVDLAAGGLLAATGEPEGPPFQLAGFQAFVTAGAYAAADALVALLAVHRGLPGQRIDLSIQEAVAALTTLVGGPKMLDDGIAPRRQPNGRASGGHPTGLYPCRDGLISISVSRPGHWNALAHWIHEVTGVEEVLDPLLQGPGLNRLQNADLIDVFVADFTSRFERKPLFHEGQRRGLAFALVSTPADLIEDPHLVARSFWRYDADEPGASAGSPYRMRHSATLRRGAVPRPGEHTAAVLAEVGFDRAVAAAREGSR
jgi:crotonobetainyl-CoA:carnitine CoA-transferase CaiB-like acyl-CoA transferase